MTAVFPEEQVAPDCNWPVLYGKCVPPDAEVQELYESIAIEYLWRWTGRQYGVCPVLIRPCRQQCMEGTSTYGPVQSAWTPTLISGRWYNVGCGQCGDTCGCQYGATLKFEKPVYAIYEITIDGIVLDPTAYRVDNARLLVRQDGQQWPFCQNLSKPLGQPGTWSISAGIGLAVPSGGQIAAGKLASELFKASCGGTGCELPQRLQTITRQGISINMALDEMVDQGRTGIWIIDSWVASVTKLDIGFSLASPDYRPVGRQTTWPTS
jgi:hypothetical protein